MHLSSIWKQWGNGKYWWLCSVIFIFLYLLKNAILISIYSYIQCCRTVIPSPASCFFTILKLMVLRKLKSSVLKTFLRLQPLPVIKCWHRRLFPDTLPKTSPHSELPRINNYTPFYLFMWRVHPTHPCVSCYHGNSSIFERVYLCCSGKWFKTFWPIRIRNLNSAGN